MEKPVPKIEFNLIEIFSIQIKELFYFLKGVFPSQFLVSFVVFLCFVQQKRSMKDRQKNIKFEFDRL